MRKIISILIFGMLLLNIVLVSANENHESEIEEGKRLVESNISCNELSDEQLEAIGDYYMEQMHPGEAHELMDQMMGGEDSESLKQMHIQMARRIYCSEDIGGMMNGGMMGMMPMMMNMMGGQNIQGNSMMQGMTGNYYSSYGVFGWIFMILIIIILVLLIVWLTKQIQNSGRVKRKRK